MKESNTVVKNSPKAWILASRPKTLTGAAVPVMIGVSMAYADNIHYGIGVLPAVLCFLFAFIMQIDANFVNDYFDFQKGNDDETRLGPRRACAQGWVSVGRMRWAIAYTTLLACVVGLPLIIFGGVEMLLVGVICIAGCFVYTTHLSAKGLGDLLVLMFFGIVPVCVTYYILTSTLTFTVFLASLACGMVIDTLLIVNNYRDIDNDRRVGKNTLVVMLGAKRAELLYLLAGFTAVMSGVVFVLDGKPFAFFLPFLYALIHFITYRKMSRIRKGKALNLILGETARNIFIYGLLVTAGILASLI